jgi:crotonobetainyl-CoA:carnitine CoA-transferase CaiB-like acyl-CoA transferase
VLDLGMVWAGPYCGRILAGLGAEVIKIEGPARPDGTRRPASDACVGAFGDLNRGKRSLVLDLSTNAGRQAFLALVARSDVVIENFSPRVMPNFGLDYVSLARVNPALLMVSMPAFGADGPWASYVAYGGGLELATGLARREVDGRPVPAPVAYLDYLAGAYAALGLLAALFARDRSGRGAHLELAQREVACQLLSASLRSQVSEPALSALRTPSPAVAGHSESLPKGLKSQVDCKHQHLVDRGLLERSKDGECLGWHYERLPWVLHGVPRACERPAPAFGADGRAVLRDVGGLGARQIDKLVEAGVVVQNGGAGGSPVPAPTVGAPPG